ncbi:hypothetical protein [Candidatus Williamhamiltonella defendens]|nr:hypothetical protein [Candidatus Hamiltonella defensa]
MMIRYFPRLSRLPSKVLVNGLTNTIDASTIGKHKRFPLCRYFHHSTLN